MSGDHEPGSVKWQARLTEELRSWFSSYAQIYFSQNIISGLLFLVATFVVPAHGASGVLGLVLTNGWAYILSRPREHIKDGYYGFNGLLVGLALGLFFRFDVRFLTLLLVASLLTVIIAAALRNLSARYFGIPVLSWPFVWVTWIALLATRRFAGVEITIDPVLVTQWGAGFFPGYIEIYLRSLGAAFFQLSVVSGILVFLGLFWFSRWAVILSIVGFVSGSSVYLVLGGTYSDIGAEFIGFNFILTAIAVGGIWVVLGVTSVMFASAAGALAAMIAAASMTLLQPLGLPVLAMPFIATTQLLLFVVMIRDVPGLLKIVRGEPSSPEQNLISAVYRDKRYPDPAVPVVYLPVLGQWTITQGPNGRHTHKGLWSHAWDFEVTDEEGSPFRGTGSATNEYYSFGAPVVSPAEGKVVRVIAHLEDNAIGEVDTKNNWGNLVIVWHSAGVYSALCHLQKSSVTVKEGDSVTAGFILGRVGNSGRSPIPHLHFQIQATADIGAPTSYGEFLHYVSGSGSDASYVTHGMPCEGMKVASMETDDVVRRALTLAPGRKWMWSIVGEKKRTTEKWTSRIDAFGNRFISDESRRTKVSFFVDDHYTTLLGVSGGRSRLLSLFYLGMPRVPYIKEAGVPWTDQPDPTVFIPLWARWIHDIILPFSKGALLGTRSTIQRSGQQVKLTTEVACDSWILRGARLPTRIEIDFEVGLGPTALCAYKKDVLLVQAEANR